MSDALPFLVVLAVILVGAVLGLRGLMSSDGRRNPRGPGAGATGAVYDMLNEDKRKALEIIVEQRAGYRDAEHADDKPDTGNDGNDRERTGTNGNDMNDGSERERSGTTRASGSE